MSCRANPLLQVPSIPTLCLHPNCKGSNMSPVVQQKISILEKRLEAPELQEEESEIQQQQLRISQTDMRSSRRKRGAEPAGRSSPSSLHIFITLHSFPLSPEEEFLSAQSPGEPESLCCGPGLRSRQGRSHPAQSSFQFSSQKCCQYFLV